MPEASVFSTYVDIRTLTFERDQVQSKRNGLNMRIHCANYKLTFLMETEGE
jgi:hypothetical protein